MEREYVDQFVKDVFETTETLKQLNVSDSTDMLLKSAVSIVDESYRENGIPGIVKQYTPEDFEALIQNKCIKQKDAEGPDIYLYTCTAKGDDPKSNSGAYTTHQLLDFAENHQGLPVYLNHVTKGLDPVGFTVGGGVNKSGQLMGGFVLFDTPLGRLAQELVETLGVRGVSLGASHKYQMIDEDTPMLTHSAPKEVSICYLGDQPDTWIKYKLPWSQRAKGQNADLIEMGPINI
jgi:hypothetical protein